MITRIMALGNPKERYFSYPQNEASKSSNVKKVCKFYVIINKVSPKYMRRLVFSLHEFSKMSIYFK